MNRLLFLLVIALDQQSSFAAVYKCEREGGKIEYQAAPCENGREVAVPTTNPTVPTVPTGKVSASSSAGASGENKKCIGKEVRIRFTNMSVKSTLQVLADFSGNRLAADSSISGFGAFNYECVPWDAVLQDIGARYNLIVRVESGTIFATKR